MPRQIRQSFPRIAGFIYHVQVNRGFSPIFGRITLCGSVFVCPGSGHPASVPLELDSEHGPFFRQRQAAGGRSGGLGLGRCPDAVIVETFLNLYKSAFLMAEVTGGGSRWCCRTPGSGTHPAAVGRAARGPRAWREVPWARPNWVACPSREGTSPAHPSGRKKRYGGDVLLFDDGLQLLRAL